jgi:hypothetical protein
MANKLIVAPAPHVHGSESTQKIMRDVLLALTPALVFSVVAFGWSALAVTCISVASCVLFEYLIQKFLLKGPSVDSAGRTSEECRGDRFLNDEMKRLWNTQPPRAGC